MTGSWPQAVARRLGIGGEVSFSTARVGQTLHLPCGKGKDAHIVDVFVKPGQNPDAIAKKLLNEGWTLGHSLTCPEHRRKSERPCQTGKQHMEKIETPAKPSDAARKAHRMLMMALEDYYDEAGKQYKDGYSDTRLAAEIGCSEQHVRETREQYFGPLAVPNDVAEFRSALDKLRAEAGQMTASIAKSLQSMEQRLDRLCKRNGWAE
ncbi:MAG: hypothetical protein A2792_03615 [Sphingomonadales bacterium RIFCSPHIGHO2_01_FULL_65_20]|nr:MAG: hypothetical protein A2792_03615 [Sphingomonadales bacterium RIFCSPHIGHO2_01_FULL_65_20]